MAQSNWQPSWYKQEKHGVEWDRVKEAMRRDWEQTKHDFGAKNPDLAQNVSDTVKQAAGKEAIPPGNGANIPNTSTSKTPMTTGGAAIGTDIGGRTDGKTAWADAESPLHYGYAARNEYGTAHKQWNEGLETKLKGEWEQAKDTTKRGWDDVKHLVRRGYEHTPNKS